MSTNNNKYNNIGKEVKPIYINDTDTQLEYKLLKLSSNKLQRLIKNDLRECNAVTLSNRSIEKLVDLELFINVNRLDLSHNHISRLNDMEKMPKLSYLNLCDNHLSSDGLEELRYVTELRTLNIGNNPTLGNLHAHVLKPLIKLQGLIMNNCNISSLSCLRHISQLNTLILSHNSIQGFDLKKYDIKLSSLIKLSLGNNKLNSFPNLFGFESLQELRLNHNNITSIPNVLSLNCKNLKILDLSHNEIKSWDDVKLLAECENLVNLSLLGNPLPIPSDDILLQTIKEDISLHLIVDNSERLYRHQVLLIFQKLVGQMNKQFIQLIVLDNKRVKAKWTQGGAAKFYQKTIDENSKDESGQLIRSNVDISISKNPLPIKDSFIENKKKEVGEVRKKASKKKRLPAETDVQERDVPEREVKEKDLPLDSPNISVKRKLATDPLDDTVQSKKSKDVVQKVNITENPIDYLEKLNSDKLLNIGQGGKSAWD